ncbi:SGNH/GDSL hydrolase family protein [Vibrio diabolicus]|uniref:SGNH/GDSL hydrolase family protein n=1 Tax=Vibrio diabolicus TaxID=50719 RepID=UPI000CE99EA7|nr:SGNH/GDSL hydrolase family protein [Vibrio diabolicus]AVF59858.1 hypothetical protein AL537_11140 [Vibrio diabolicus]
MSVTRRGFIKLSGLVGASFFFPSRASSNEVVGSSSFFNNTKSVSILGDSITHGAFAGDVSRNGWANLLTRALNAEYGTHSYGYTPYTKLGSGEHESYDIAQFSKSGEWAGLSGADADNFVSGFGYRSATIGSSLTFKIPAFMSRVLIHYMQRPDGAEIDVLVNGRPTKVIESKGIIDNFACAGVDLFDNGSGEIEIQLVIKSDGYFDFSGISYLSSYSETVCNNYSHSGRRLRYTSDVLVNNICENSQTLIMALGHNDSGESEDLDYRAAFRHVIDTLIHACNRHKVNVIVPDFVWARSESNWVRVELMRLASETNGVYINFPKMLEKSEGIPADRNHLINTLGMWVDVSHPNEEGNKWIFEEIAKAMNLSCQTKEEALTAHEFNFPPSALTPEPEPEITKSGSSGGSIGLFGTAGLVALGYIKAVRTRN